MFDKSKSEMPGQLPVELATLERQLTSLVPGMPRIDRDQLMFDAGRAAALALAPQDPGKYSPAIEAIRTTGQTSPARFWRLATFLSTAASIALAVLLVRQPRPTEGVAPVVPQVAKNQPDRQPSDAHFASMPAAASEQPTFWAAWIMPLPPASGYIAKRDAVLSLGPAAWDYDPPRLSAGVEAGSTPQATVRDLMEEYLPGSTQELDIYVLLP